MTECRSSFFAVDGGVSGGYPAVCEASEGFERRLVNTGESLRGGTSAVMLTVLMSVCFRGEVPQFHGSHACIRKRQ